MSFKYSDIEGAGLLTFDFQTMSLSETQELAKIFNELLLSQLNNQPEAVIGVAFEGEQGAGKTPLIEGILGIETCYGNHRKDRGIPCLTDNNPWPRYSTVFLEGLNTVSWIDVGWEMFREPNQDVITDNRAEFLALYPDLAKGGVNIIEHPDLCRWDPELSYVFEATVLSRYARNYKLSVEKQVAESKDFQTFLDKAAKFQPRPLI